MALHPLGVTLVARQGVGGSQNREVVHAGELPHLLDVARDVLGPVVDPEAVVTLRRPPTGHGVEEPVRILHVLAHDAQDLEAAGEDLVPRRQDAPTGLDRNPGEDARGQGGLEPGRRGRKPRNRLAGPAPAKARGGGRGAHGNLVTGPGRLLGIVREPPHHLRGGHLLQPSEIPLEPRGVHGSSVVSTRSGSGTLISDIRWVLPLVRLAPAPSVARVVATSDPREIGMGAPLRTASKNARTSLC